MSGFCPQCGAQLSASQKFCTDCGAAVTAPAPSGTAPATSQASSTSRFGSGRMILVASLVIGGAALAAALIVVGPKLQPSPPSVPVATTPPVAAPPVATAATPANSGTARITADRWTSYVNDRYGVIVEYPADLFEIQPPPPDNAGRDFTADKAGARFFVYSHANAMSASLQELQAEDVLDIGDGTAVKNNGADWYQVTATKGTDTILRRVLLSEGGEMVHRLEIVYPKTAAAAFAPVTARMIRSFRVDPTIFEKAANAANAAPPPTVNAPTPVPPAPGWQRFNWSSLRIPGYSGRTGMTMEVPLGWSYFTSANSERRETNVLDFNETEANTQGTLYVSFRAERHGPKATLASEAKVIKTRLSEGADNYRLLSERTTQIAARPAIVFSMQFSGSDKPDLLREDVAIVDAGPVFYFITSGAPATRYAAISKISAHVLETLGFAE